MKHPTFYIYSLIYVGSEVTSLLMCKPSSYNQNWQNLLFFVFQIVIEPVPPHASGSLFCEKCNKSFVSKLGYDKHMNAHKGIYRYTCKTCNKGFTCTSNYKAHMATHTGLNYFQCHKCLERFKNYRHLQKHKSLCQNNTSHQLCAFGCENTEGEKPQTM